MTCKKDVLAVPPVASTWIECGRGEVLIRGKQILAQETEAIDCKKAELPLRARHHESGQITNCYSYYRHILLRNSANIFCSIEIPQNRHALIASTHDQGESFGNT